MIANPVRSLRSAVALTVAALCAGSLLPAHAAKPGLRLVKSFSYTSGLDIDAVGDRLYALASGAESGIKVFDVGDKPREIAHVDCPNAASDVAAVRDGLVAISFQLSTGSSCAGGLALGGVQVIDVNDLRRPRYLDDVALPEGVHTITAYPGRDLVFASPGGAEVHAANQGLEQIIDVSDPANIEVVATYRPETLPFGCHDLLFKEIGAKVIGFCPGMGGTEIWDATDPLAPKKIGSMLLPAAQLPHSVSVNSDATLAVVGEEAWAAHECTAGAPVGGLWVYDISVLEEPVLLGRFRATGGRLPAGTEQVAPCTAHNFEFIPGTDLLVSAWYTGGTRLIDFSDPAQPVERASYAPAGGSATSAYWHDGRIYVADFERGLDVLRLDGTPAGPRRARK